MLTDFTSFEVDKKIVNYFSYFNGEKNKKKQTLPKNSKKNISCGVPYKYSG
jgi:hypothetical protein